MNDTSPDPAGAGSADERPVAVEVDHLTHRFGHYAAVDDLSLRIRAGDCFALLGPNGAGKTTTIRLINTLLPVQEGRITVFGHDVGHDPFAVRRRIGYVPQQLSIESALTGRENVAWFARLYDMPRRQRRQRVEEALEMVNLTGEADRLASTYSGGMIRRLELAQALVNEPSVLILDEPTVGLDPIARDSVWDRVEQMQQHNSMTILLTTHYMEEAAALCDRVAMMSHGHLAAEGTPAELTRSLGDGATLEDVFRHYAGVDLSASDDHQEGFRHASSTRRTAGRMG